MSKFVQRGYNPINVSAIIKRHDFTALQDKAQIESQLRDSKFTNLSSNMMYRPRLSDSFCLTNGHTAITANAVIGKSFISKFSETLWVYADQREDRDTVPSYAIRDLATSFGKLQELLETNHLDEMFRERFKVKSPKFSKFLVREFGERSPVLKIFNERPKTFSDLTVKMQCVDEQHVLVVSNLACNVMKMSAGNSFWSCQDYEDSNDMDNLSSLPTSVHDETLSIAYIMKNNDDILYPKMAARALLKTFEYEERIFILAYNFYGNDMMEMLKQSLRNLYGTRVLFVNELSNPYLSGEYQEFTYKFDYGLQVMVEDDSDEECYCCEGSGDVTATVKWHGIEFTATCPVCDGEGHIEGESETYERFPYVDHEEHVCYDCDWGKDICSIRVADVDLQAVIDYENSLQAIEAYEQMQELAHA